MKNKKLIPEIRFSEFTGEWKERRLGEIGKIKYGKGQNEIKNKIGNFPIIGTSGILGTSGEYLYDKESVILGRKGTIEKPIYINKPFWCVDTTFFFEFYKDYVPKFIFYLLNKINWKIYNESTGVPSLSLNTIKKIKIHIPEPKEQQKIADFLSKVDEKIEITAKKIKELKKYKKGMLQKLLNVELKKIPELRFPEFNGEWIEKKLGEIAKIYQPKTISEKEFTLKGYPVYGANGKIGYYHTYNHEKWQVIITCRGSTSGTINKTENKTWITGNSMVINTDENEKINKKFLYYLLQIQNFKKVIEGSGQPQITQTSLKNFKIHLPPTLAEQQKIADFLSTVDEKIEINKQKLIKLKEYKKGLLQKMLI